MPSNRRLATVSVLAATAATGAAAVPAASARDAAAAAARQFEGRVVSVDRPARAFRLRDAERGVVRIQVRPSTRYERLSGFRALRRGMRGIEATVRRSGERWVASVVERSGGGGRHGGHGGDDDGGRDD
jgi:hypothetical protein